MYCRCGFTVPLCGNVTSVTLTRIRREPYSPTIGEVIDRVPSRSERVLLGHLSQRGVRGGGNGVWLCKLRESATQPFIKAPSLAVAVSTPPTPVSLLPVAQSSGARRLSHDNRVKQCPARLLLGWATAERSCPYK
ncbi:hypothetical protein J6590_010753 [Homalodisca vitripennis]|nr:hypothetical protein J6590_010753 [Homalodisca vitripennis]